MLPGRHHDADVPGGEAATDEARQGVEQWWVSLVELHEMLELLGRDHGRNENEATDVPSPLPLPWRRQTPTDPRNTADLRCPPADTL